jgi:hypothetical protein
MRMNTEIGGPLLAAEGFGRERKTLICAPTPE